MSDATVTLTVEGQPASAARCDQLFVVANGDHPLAPASRHALDEIDEIRIGRAPAGLDACRRGVRLDLGVPDRRVSGAHARLSRGPDGWVLEDLGSKNGTYLAAARVEAPVLVPAGAVFSIGHTFFLLAADREAAPTPDALAGRPIDDARAALATLSPELGRAFADLIQVLATDAAILIVGDSGTGKERVVRAIHALSARPGALVAVACGGLPSGRAADELLGHARGAFAGAVDDTPGLVRAADRGTLFLDEVGDLALDAQPALLRVLQEREVTPLGAAHPVDVDLRVVAATHRDLAAAVAAGQFRGDLLGRLRGFTLRLPPLRERREDIGLLIAEVLRRHARQPESVALTRRAMQALLAYSWPDNVRELEQALQVALALAEGGEIQLAHLPEPLRRDEAPAAGPESWPPTEGPWPGEPADALPRDQRRAAQLIQLLTEHGGNVAAVSRALGKQRTLVHRWLRRLGIDPERYRS